MFFIDRNCCSPKGWGTLIVKKSAAWGHDIGYRVPMHRWQIASEPIFVAFVVRPRGGRSGWSRKSRQGWWERMSNVLVRLFKDRGTRHPEEDGIEEIAQAWSLFVSPPSFASLSLHLAPQRSFSIFNRAKERTPSEREEKICTTLRDIGRVYSLLCRETYIRAGWKRFGIVDKKPWTEVNKKSRVLVIRQRILKNLRRQLKTVLKRDHWTCLRWFEHVWSSVRFIRLYYVLDVRVNYNVRLLDRDEYIVKVNYKWSELSNKSNNVKRLEIKIGSYFLTYRRTLIWEDD